MSRRKYMMLSKQHYLDTQTNKVITKSERANPNLTLVPSYFWDESYKTSVATGFNLVNGELQNSFSNYSEVNTLQLPGIHFIIKDLYSADILFYDGRKHERHEINIMGYPSMTVSAKDTSKQRLDRVLFDMIYDGQKAEFKSELFIGKDRGHYKGVGYLAQMTQETCAKNARIPLTYGVLYKQFNIIYKDFELDGSCYVLFYGTFGILLRDNLSFDALVIFDGYTKDTVYIQQFIYTSNPYLIKTILRLA